MNAVISKPDFMDRAIERLSNAEDLDVKLARGAMNQLMEGNCSDAQIGAFLIGLSSKGETPEEIAALAEVMREKSVKVAPKSQFNFLDVCGTGGAPSKTFNVSTTSAFAIAGAGVPVAKHGNRSNTSRSGSADLLEALGVNLGADPGLVSQILEEIGIAFLYAPNLHPAMKYAAGPRKQLGVKSVFNILGPLTNPARASYHLLGVFSEELVEVFPRVLNSLGVKRALVVHGRKGEDEVSLCAPTLVGQLREGEITRYEITPEEFGFERVSPEQVSDLPPEESARLAKDILRGEDEGPRAQMVLLNGGAGVFAAGAAESIEEGIGLIRRSIEDGLAYGKLEQLVELSGGSLNV